MLRCWPVLLLFMVAGCGLPLDPEGTTKRLASTHELRVGVTDNQPWTDSTRSEPSGLEPALVRAFAARIGAKVEWTKGSETALAQALKHHELDLAIGGFDARTPWVSMAGISQPFAETPDKKKHVFLTAPGENQFILTLDTFLTEQLRKSKGARS
jgi:polar amino acid transport system substrate-binding protein